MAPDTVERPLVRYVSPEGQFKNFLLSPEFLTYRELIKAVARDEQYPTVSPHADRQYRYVPFDSSRPVSLDHLVLPDSAFPPKLWILRVLRLILELPSGAQFDVILEDNVFLGRVLSELLAAIHY